MQKVIVNGRKILKMVQADFTNPVPPSAPDSMAPPVLDRMNTPADQAPDSVPAQAEAPTPGPVDPLQGRSRRSALNFVNNILSQYTKGFFKDNSWQAVQKIWDALNAAGINWQVRKNEYTQGEKEQSPNGKRWEFVVNYTNFKHR